MIQSFYAGVSLDTFQALINILKTGYIELNLCSLCRTSRLQLTICRLRRKLKSVKHKFFDTLLLYKYDHRCANEKEREREKKLEKEIA